MISGYVNLFWVYFGRITVCEFREEKDPPSEGGPPLFIEEGPITDVEQLFPSCPLGTPVLI